MEFLKVINMPKKNKFFLSLLEISSRLLEYSRLTDWYFPAYYWDTPETYLTLPILKDLSDVLQT